MSSDGCNKRGEVCGEAEGSTLLFDPFGPVDPEAADDSEGCDEVWKSDVSVGLASSLVQAVRLCKVSKNSLGLGSRRAYDGVTSGSDNGKLVVGIVSQLSSENLMDSTAERGSGAVTTSS
jgi:hypothetical protein